jgi:hypothetical protein
MDELPLPYEYSSHPIGRGHSHLIKRTDLDVLLSGEPPGTVASVTRWHSQWIERVPEEYLRWTGWTGRPPVVAAAGWMPLCSARWLARRSGQGAWLSFYTVPSARRAELRALTTSTVLPDVLDWARAIAHGPETRRDTEALLLWYVDAGQLARAEC